jgi:hypothetical protein
MVIGKTEMEGNLKQKILKHIYKKIQKDPSSMEKRRILPNSKMSFIDKNLSRVNMSPSQRIAILKLKWNMISCAEHWIKRDHITIKDPNCPTCNCPHSKEHVLLHCRKNQEARAAILKRIKKILIKAEIWDDCTRNLEPNDFLYRILRLQPSVEFTKLIPKNIRNQIGQDIIKAVAKHAEKLIEKTNQDIYKPELYPPPENTNPTPIP